MKKNELYDVIVESVTNTGEGIGKIDGFTLFIAEGVTGDRVEVQITKIKKTYGYARINKMLEPSPYRTQPKCLVARKCGGCNFMHIEYDYQLQLKTKYIEDVLKRIGKLENVEVLPCIGMENPWEYRNKMIFPIGKNKDGKAVFGFYENRSHTIVAFERCYLGEVFATKIAACVVDFMNEFGVEPYDEVSNKGTIRRVFVRNGYESKEIMVVISSNIRKVKKQELLVERLKQLDENIVSIILNINQGLNNNVLGDENINLWGKDTIVDTLCGSTFEISPHSFFQVNPIQTDVLYKKAIEFAEITEKDVIFDLYCGIGTISLYAANYAKEVVGIEIVPQAIENAKENAKNNDVKNVSFICGAAEDVMPKLCDEGKNADVVILDPPRKGSDVITLESICFANPKRIVYVSCDGATLARDVAFLKDKGYQVQKVQPVDMFGQTGHVECVVLMSRVQK